MATESAAALIRVSAPLIQSPSNSSTRQEQLGGGPPPPSTANQLRGDAGPSPRAPISSSSLMEEAGSGASEEGDESGEHLRISLNVLPVVSGSGINGDNSTHPASPRAPSASPTRNATVAMSQMIPRRRGDGVQTTLISSLVPPPPPQLPNLAQEALQRLAQSEAARSKDDSIDDFRPLKKRKLWPEIDNDAEEEEEVKDCTHTCDCNDVT